MNNNPSLGAYCRAGGAQSLSEKRRAKEAVAGVSRPIVEFAVENYRKLQQRQKRLADARARNAKKLREDRGPHDRDRDATTKKERRLVKRLENRLKKRTAKASNDDDDVSQEPVHKKTKRVASVGAVKTSLVDRDSLDDAVLRDTPPPSRTQRKKSTRANKRGPKGVDLVDQYAKTLKRTAVDNDATSAKTIASDVRLELATGAKGRWFD